MTHPPSPPTIRRLTCRLHGHLWELISYNSATETATLRCMRCNPDGNGSPTGVKVVPYLLEVRDGAPAE